MEPNSGTPKPPKKAIKAAVFSISIVLYIVAFFTIYRSMNSTLGVAGYIPPVILASWFWGLRPGLIASGSGIALNIILLLLVGEMSSFAVATIQGIIFYTLIAWGIGYLSDTNNKLKKALDEIKTLKSLLPICAGCKKIRDDEGYWNEVESYMEKHTRVEFTHTLCPDCIRKFYPRYTEETMMERRAGMEEDNDG